MENTGKNFNNNNPNPSRLIGALRNVGYDTFSAIADIIDNSIDAGGTNISVDVVKTSGDDLQIQIIDNGCGMTFNILDQAMRLGSDTDREIKSDLGKFGMGLITASISIGKKLTVITKHNDEYFTSIQDLDYIVKINKFEKEIRSSSNEEKKYFNSKVSPTENGTIAIIENCDLIQNKNINELVLKLNEELGRIFRFFIKNNVRISVNNKLVKGIDPLYLYDERTETICDESFEIELNDRKEQVEIKIALLPNFDNQTCKLNKVNISNQGFYIMRNNREIASGITLGTFTKHNDFNRLRMELCFSGNLDQEMNINFTKKNISPKQIVLDRIKRIVAPQIVSIRRSIKSAQAVNDNTEIDHEVAAKIIANKSKQLIKPKIKIEIRNPISKHPGAIIPTHSGTERTPGLNSRAMLSDKVNCKFEFRSKGDNGVLFDCEQIGKKTIIYYNIDHPFYQSFIAKNKDNQELVNAFDFVTYAFASAQLTLISEDNVSLFDAYQSIFSSNLRTLIS